MGEPSIKIICENTEPYIPSAGYIYREAFPDHRRSQLGQKTCERFLRVVSKHKAYQLMIALIDNESAGFAIFHIDLLDRVGRRWLVLNIISILKLLVLNPPVVFKMASHVIRRIRHARKIKAKAPVNNDLVRTRPFRAYIESLAVKQSYRGLGVGKRLLEECIRVARENNKQRLAISVDIDNYSALVLYRAMGFKPQEPVGGKVDLVYDIET